MQLKQVTVYKETKDTLSNFFVKKWNKVRVCWGNGFYAEEKQAIPLTKEELLKIIGEAFDAGVNREYANHFGTVPNVYPDKHTFINSLQIL